MSPSLQGEQFHPCSSWVSYQSRQPMRLPKLLVGISGFSPNLNSLARLEFQISRS